MKDPQPATSIDICNITSIEARFASMEDRLKSYEDMHERFTSPIMRYLDTLSTQMMNVQKDIDKLNDQHDFQEEVVKHEKLGEGGFKIESSMSFGGSHWCRPMSMDALRSTDQDEDRSIEYSINRLTSSAESTAKCSAVRIMTHEEFAEKHPHPPSPFYVKIDRPLEPAVDRQRETDIDRPPSPPINRRAPLTYRVRLPSIDSNRISALTPPPKPLANPP
ncbi:hypothetical protein F2Q69_00047309 [Brassica cretica]|uniref:Uncharacterized protein n=1 Tax=Brassica cretica TaxID=69181 RepID=A0A8S9Q322_BRACR|nr:hypothetical protein F2Q69_00047309 [Brassica cretica]